MRAPEERRLRDRQKVPCHDPTAVGFRELGEVLSGKVEHIGGLGTEAGASSILYKHSSPC